MEMRAGTGNSWPATWVVNEATAGVNLVIILAVWSGHSATAKWPREQSVAAMLSSSSDSSGRSGGGPLNVGSCYQTITFQNANIACLMAWARVLFKTKKPQSPEHNCYS